MKKKRNLLILALLLVVGVTIGLVTFNIEKIMDAVWEFRDGFVGIPRR